MILSTTLSEKLKILYCSPEETEETGHCGLLKAKNGDVTLGLFMDAKLTPASGYFIRFYEDEAFVGFLKKVHVRGFQCVEAGTLVKQDGPSFCGFFKGTKLLIPNNSCISENSDDYFDEDEDDCFNLSELKSFKRGCLVFEDSLMRIQILEGHKNSKKT